MLAFVLAGAFSGAGKTSFGEAFLSWRPGITVVKVTPDEELDQCDVIVSDAISNEKATKDTSRYSVNAEKVLWLTGPRSNIRKKLHEIVLDEHKSNREIILLEGNAAMAALPWAISIFVTSLEDREWKESAYETLERSAFAVINMYNGSAEDADKVEKKIRKVNPAIKTVRMDMQNGLNDDFKAYVETLVEDYAKTRTLVLNELSKEGGKVSCRRAREIAAACRVPVARVGWICEEAGSKIHSCELGCF